MNLFGTLTCFVCFPLRAQLLLNARKLSSSSFLVPFPLACYSFSHPSYLFPHCAPPFVFSFLLSFQLILSAAMFAPGSHAARLFHPIPTTAENLYFLSCRKFSIKTKLYFVRFVVRRQRQFDLLAPRLTRSDNGLCCPSIAVF